MAIAPTPPSTYQILKKRKDLPMDLSMMIEKTLRISSESDQDDRKHCEREVNLSMMVKNSVNLQ